MYHSSLLQWGYCSPVPFPRFAFRLCAQRDVRWDLLSTRLFATRREVTCARLVFELNWHRERSQTRRCKYGSERQYGRSWLFHKFLKIGFILLPSSSGSCHDIYPVTDQVCSGKLNMGGIPRSLWSSSVPPQSAAGS